MTEEIEDLLHRISVKEQELANLRTELQVAQESAHPFKVGQEVEAYAHVAGRDRYDFQRAKILSIQFFSDGPHLAEYRVSLLKKDGDWSPTPRYTAAVRLPQ